ncbi:hypothetical protein KDU71_17235 [Carboxylicivirga sediminis]|uniref:Outer membrane protein beta-barrel domain-containing protein n=1 Tax=Carboxylicivirga sediminis TaxID=2006564 RepID=A0A941IXY0_9BACT|nr:DUF6588 family protein [Carboxylicivirga sediminis]MBR8537316.1 hypothetical protein [Carboxylicivirga sediminis]
MKKIRFILFIAFIASAHALFGQGQIIDFLKAGQADANTLSQAYLLPYGEMLGVNLNSGWYNSAKVHKVGGFDFTITASYTTAPNSKKSFDPQKLPLTVLEQNTPGMAPTMAGSDKESMGFHFKDDPFKETVLNVEGANADFFVSPMIQAAVGLPFHTEIMGRFMPKTTYGDFGKAGLWGLGVKHEIKEYIPFVKRVPFLEASVLAAYTDFTADLSVDEPGVGAGKLETSAGAFTSRLLLGVNVPVVSFYTGLGYGTTTSNFDLKGTFNAGDEGELTDPVALEYKTDGFDFNAGMRIRLGIFSIHGDYSIGEYAVITGGVGINFR